MGWNLLSLIISTHLIFYLDTNFGCRLSEFACDNGRCISLSKYCDGTDDCSDASDESLGCSSCNKTLYGDVNTKYPLRITEPFQRYLPFVCKITFKAEGGEYGDIIELTFLSFHIGTLEFGRNQTQICPKGHLQIIETSSNSDNRPVKSTRHESWHSSDNKLYPSSPSFGLFCGNMAERTTFYSEESNVTLIVVVPNRASINSFTFSLYMTYKFLPSTPSFTRYGPRESPYYLGARVPGSYCDVYFSDCDRKKCKIRSPNFPGFYLRNFTCNYRIKQDLIPTGYHAQLALSQGNEYKISLCTGSTSSGASRRTTLTKDCFSDTVRVYDGPSPSSSLLMEFCGTGSLPEIVTSGPEVLVQLHSSPYQVMHNSRVELDVEVKFVRVTEFRLENGRCTFLVDGSKQRHGLIYSPRNTMPKNTTCVVHLMGASDYDRIWLYFLSYFVRDKQHWTGTELCDVSTLEIYNVLSKRKRTVHNGLTLGEPDYRFCEKTTPNMCARAADYMNNIPLRPCALPEESYLSDGPEMLLRYTLYSPSEVSTMSSLFVARFEFVDTYQEGNTNNWTRCGSFFDSSTSSRGKFSSPANLFFFGRGGNTNLTCSYRFKGVEGERVRITLTKMKLKSDSCVYHYDDVYQKHRCKMSDRRIPQGATLTATEEWDRVSSVIGCICAISDWTPKPPIVLESISSNVTIQFKILGMSPFEDYEDYSFEGYYEFVKSAFCQRGLVRNNKSSEGNLEFLATKEVEDNPAPIRCRWFIEAAPHKYLYLKIQGRDGTRGCRADSNRLIIYSGLELEPTGVVCLTENPNEIVDAFSFSWYNETHAGGMNPQRDHVYVEVIFRKVGSLILKWLEVTKSSLRTHSGQTLRNVNCLYECPELNMCIAPELWCDGNMHCPTGYDETPEHCDRFPVLYAAVGGSGGLFLLVIVFITIAHCLRRRSKSKHTRRLPTEEFQLESPSS
ncbi:uncharacterized protein LOC111638886 [Centruroides sculpturatus]|uniref:uncharacterized protein LOC111638886 n=1 Tax=Centruroides sculpturatus TaxID=218467 RepID=UPI000C6DE4BF|nr:uncharacterized protein LOC111638886 [Centruroides sculpturatus]